MFFKHRATNNSDRSERYITLEADSSRNIDLSIWPLPVESGKQVIVYDETEVHFHDGLKAVGKHEKVRYAIWPMRWKGFFFTGLFIIAMITIGVLAGVFASRTHAKGASPQSNLTPFNLTFPLNSGAGLRRNIAALSYALNSTNSTRLYYQDSAGQLWTAAKNASERLRFTAANGSALVAAVSPPNYPLLDPENIIHDTLYSTSNNSWNAGTISNEGYKAHPNSGLSALLHQCALCTSNIIISFQDESGKIQIGNMTDGRWSLTQLDLDPILGTGLALQPYYVEGVQDQINLYFQKTNGNLSMAAWRPNSGENGVGGWDVNPRELHPILPGSSIAAASSYAASSSASNNWNEVFSLSSSGFKIDTGPDSTNNWSEFDNLPAATSSNMTYSSIAVTALGRVFAVGNTPGESDIIQSWQLENSLVEWEDTGTVDTGGAWE